MMKKTIFYLTMLVLPASAILAQNKHQKQDVWIDRFDLEGNGMKYSSNTTVRGETWTSITDYVAGGESTLSKIYSVPDKEHGQVLEMKYTLAKGQSKSYPFVGVYCNVQASTYPKHIVYVAYDYKGPYHVFSYMTSDVTDYNFFKKTVPASEAWTTVLIPLSDLKQDPDHGKQVPFNPEALSGIQWLIAGNDGDKGSLMIDNIRLVYTPIESKNYEDQ